MWETGTIMWETGTIMWGTGTIMWDTGTIKLEIGAIKVWLKGEIVVLVEIFVIFIFLVREFLAHP